MHVDFEPKSSRVLLGALISVTLGVVFLKYPTGIAAMLIIVFGWGLGILGLTGIFTGLRSQNDATQRVVSCATGTVELVIGLLVALNPNAFIAVIFILIGLFVFVTGISDFATANALSSEDSAFSRPLFVIAIATVILGVLIIALPMVAAHIAGYVTGVILLANGVSEAVRAFKM